MLDDKDAESDARHYRCRIGDVYFVNYDEAEAWVKAGNISGCYTVVSQIWCTHHDWQDERFDRITDRYECYECSAKQRAQQAAEQARRAADQKALEAWTKGLPL